MSDETLFNIILTCVIYGFCALLMLAIGVKQLKSKSPVGFYSGQKPPLAQDLTDVNMWNKKHGWMWIIYGIIIIISGIVSCFMSDSALILIPSMGGLLVPAIFMIMYHKYLVKLYIKN